MSGTAARTQNTADKAYAVEARLNALGLYSDANSINRYVDANANPMQVAKTHLTTGSNTTINQTTPQSLGLTYTVVSGSQYRIQGIFFAVQGGTASGQFFGWTGPATSFVRIGYSLGQSTTNQQNAWTNTSGIGSANGIGWGAGAAAQGWVMFYFGTVTFSAGGTFQAAGWCSNAANTYTMQSGTAFDIEPI